MLVIVSWLINNYGSKMYLVYFSMWTLGFLCAESISQITVMLFSENLGTTLAMGIVIQSLFIIFANSVIFVNEMHYSVKLITEFNHARMMWECIVISIYNVCESNEFSTVLYTFGLNGDEFWPNVIRLVIIAIFWKIIAIFVYCLKTNTYFIVNNSKDNIEDQPQINKNDLI